MLILTRRVGETFRIGDNIEVVVLGQQAGQVRLGIQAPDNITILRQEVYDRQQVGGTHQQTQPERA